MLTYLRYSLATFCFAASVGCLALWLRSCSIVDELAHNIPAENQIVLMTSSSGTLMVGHFWGPDHSVKGPMWEFSSYPLAGEPHAPGNVRLVRDRRFGIQKGSRFLGSALYLPLWYPALIFALAGVGVIRFRRQFSIRSALIAFAVVAALLAMPLTL